MLNAQILGAADAEGALRQFKMQVLCDLNVLAEEYVFLDQAHVASLLYCLLVVPKELLKLETKDQVFSTLDDLDILRHFSITEQPAGMSESPSYWLVRLLRNSVAHVLYRVDAANNWEFWTEQGHIWRATASRDSLLSFLTEAGRILANRALALKSAH
jgi:hypothetical protein